MKRFIIIDGNAIIHRAYHALPPLTTKDGIIVNAVFGFSSMLLKVMNSLKPNYLAVSFDRPGKTFRDDMFEDYKATRVKADQDLYDQIPLCHDIVEAFNIPIFEQDGYEADDLIGTIVEKVKTQAKGKDEIIVVTGDKDLLQLVDKQIVQVALLNRGLADFVLYDEEKVHEKFGFGPELIPDFKGFMGDSSDNIPGVRGIGKVGATKLLQAFGTVESAYKKTEEEIIEVIKPGGLKKLKEGKDMAALSKKLATIVRDIEDVEFSLEKCLTHEFDNEEIEGLFRSYEFYSLIKRVPGSKESPSKPSKKKKRLEVIEIDKENVEELFSLLKLHSHCAVEPFVSGTHIYNEVLDGVLLIFEGTRAAYIRNNHKDFDKVLELMCEKNRVLIGHDLKRLVRMFAAKKMTCDAKLFDVMVASYIVNSSTRAHEMAAVLDRELGVVVEQSEKQTNLFGADIQGAAQVFQHCEALHKHLKKEMKEQEQLEVFETMEMPLIFVLAQMEVTGITLEVSTMKVLSKKVTKELAALTKKIHTLAGKEFNIASSVQLRDMLFDDLELPTKGIKKGKTGYSTAARELGKLRELHPIIEHVEKFRELEKLRNTYVDVLPTLVDPKNDRIHTTFNQAVATTGRLSSSDPNLQNIPIRTEEGKKIRDAFVAQKGYSLVAADYSQIELRIAAHLAKDKKMMKIFKSGEDVHASTAAVIHGVKLEEVTKEQRRSAKEVNFGVLYGMGAFGLAERTGLPQWQAKEFIEAYFEGFPQVKQYLDDTLEEAKDTGYVETVFGHRRYIPELSSANFQMRAAGERMAINMPMQGTAAEIMKLAMIDVYEVLQQEGVLVDDSVRLLLQVHDELVLEVKTEKAQEVAEQIKKIMEDVVELDVPVIVDVHVGKSWGGIK